MATSAERKYDALIFWGNHGLSATQDAFTASRSTLFASVSTRNARTGVWGT